MPMSMGRSPGIAVLAVQFDKSIPRWVIVRGLGRWLPKLATGPLGLVRLRDVSPPKLPAPRWARVATSLSGICGSDLASITTEGSAFFSPVTSFPFTMGHEVVGRVVEVGSGVRSTRVGDRVVIEPALHCEVRGVAARCEACRRGENANCSNVTLGDVSAGVQTGYCRDTGGGWSANFVVHESQLHKIPDQLSDEDAVMIEPFCCALHAVLLAEGLEPVKRGQDRQADVLVLGCGTIGLLTIAALRALDVPCKIFAVAKHPHQQEKAVALGADVIVPAGRGLRGRLAKACNAAVHWPEIGGPSVLGGFDRVFCCVGSSRALDDAVRFTRARAATVLVGMPAFVPKLDWTTIWFKENRVLGAYAYGMEKYCGESINTFDLAIRLLQEGKVELGPFVTHRFPLAAYRQAIGTALFTGKHRSIKTVFDLTM